ARPSGASTCWPAGMPRSAARRRNDADRPAPMNADNRRLDRVLAAVALALLLLPWYRVRSGFFGLDWLAEVFGKPDLWPGLAQAAAGRWQFWPVLALIAAAVWLRLRTPSGPRRGRTLVWLGAAGLAWMAAQGLSIGTRGWNWSLLE